jgi:hypothetical protein
VTIYNIVEKNLWKVVHWNMPAKGQKNMELYKKKANDVVGTNKTVRSQLNASKKYDKENVDNIRLRVPKGWNEVLKGYVKTSGKYSSVNAMLNELIKKKMQAEGIELPEKD